MSERDYIETVGHEPPVDDSDERWQWEYRGTPAERAELLARLQACADPHDEPQAEQETLFGNTA